MPNLIERCNRQLSGECKDCRFDCHNTKRDSVGNEILYSEKNSKCFFGYDPQRIPYLD